MQLVDERAHRRALPDPAESAKHSGPLHDPDIYLVAGPHRSSWTDRRGPPEAGVSKLPFQSMPKDMRVAIEHDDSLNSIFISSSMLRERFGSGDTSREADLREFDFIVRKAD